MSERGFLFIFSCIVIVASLGATVWLIATGQAASVDGLFLMLYALTVAAGFGLYVMFLIKRAMQQLAAPEPKAAKSTAAAKPKAAPLVAAEKTE